MIFITAILLVFTVNRYHTGSLSRIELILPNNTRYSLSHFKIQTYEKGIFSTLLFLVVGTASAFGFMGADHSFGRNYNHEYYLDQSK